MPTFQIEDERGRVLEIEGDREPNESELKSLFSETFGDSLSTQTKKPGFIARGLTAFGEAMAGQQLPKAGVPAVTVPRVGEPGTFTRGVSEGVSGLIEGATTPEGVMAAGLLGVPGVNVALGTLMTAAGAKEAAQLAGEASVTGDPETIGKAATIGGATLLGAAATGALARGAPPAAATEAPAQTVIPESRRLTGPSIRLSEFSGGTLEPGGPPRQRLPAPGETEGSILLPASEQAPRTAGFRIELPLEGGAAKAARQVWSKPIDIEAQVTGVEAIRQVARISEELATPGQPYKPPTVSVDLRQLERTLQRNTVSKVESWADEVLQRKQTELSANAFLDPEFMAAAAVKGAILVKRGVTDFAEWSNEMRKQFGRGFDDKLPLIFQQAMENQPAKEVAKAATPPEAKAPEVAKPTEAKGIAQMRSELFMGVEQNINDYLRKAPRDEVQEKYKLASDLLREIETEIAERKKLGENEKELFPLRYDVDGFRAVLEHKLMTEPAKPPPVRPEEQAGLRAIEVAPNTFSPSAVETSAGKVAGISPAGSLMDVGATLKYEGRRWFTVRGHLPPEVQALKREMEGQVSKADLEVKLSTTTLMDALSEHYGIGAIGRAGGGSRKIPVAAVEAMDAYLKGKVSNPAAIPQNIRGALDTMRAEIDSWSAKIRNKLITQANRHPAGSPEWQKINSLAETIQNNMDVYVHRSYRFFDSKERAPKWYADLPLGVRDSAEQFVTQNAPGMTVEQARSKLLDWLSDLRDESSGGTGSKLGAKDLSIFMRRKVIAPEIKAVLGEHQSPLINYARSVSKMASWVARQKFLEDVKNAGMGKFLFEEGANPPGFNAKLAAEGSETMSPLNGLRTSDEIARAFKEMDAVPTQSLLARTYLAVNAWTKFAATAWSMLTQQRNLGSRSLMATWAGHWDVTVVPKAVQLVIADARGRATPQQKATLARARELGMMDEIGRSGELQAVLKDAALQEVSPGELYSWSLLKALKHYGKDIPAEFYQGSDRIGSLAGWLIETENQLKVNPNFTRAQAEAKAASIVRNIYPFYSESPKFVKAFRRVPLTGPFVTFPYQMMRVIWNGLAQSIHEIRSANSAEQALGYKRLGSQVATMAVVYGLQEAGKAALGISTQQEDDFRRFQPPWARNSKWLFTSRDMETGELGGINLSYMDPFSYAADPVVAVFRSLREGKDLFDVFSETTREMFTPWISEQMLTQALIEARNGMTDTGREIYNPTDDSLEKFSKQTRHVLRALEPGTLQRLQKRIIPAARNEQPLFGRKLELAPEIVRETTGIAVEKFSFKNGLAYKAREFTELDRASERIFHETVSQTKTTTGGDILEAYKASDERRLAVWKEMRGDFLAAVRNGVDASDAQRLLVARGVSKRDARSIAQGVYLPMSVSDQAKRRARERGRTLPMVEIRTYQMERRGLSLDHQASGVGAE